MKKFKLFALTALFCGMSSSAFAQSKADGHYRYDVLSSTTAEIIGFVANQEVAAVEIPVQVQDPEDATKKYDVVSVGIKAFQNQTGITSVTIPDTKVATIKAGAFAGCTNLTTVTIGKAVTVIDNALTWGAVANATALTIGNVYYTAENGATRYLQAAAYTTTSATDRYTAATFLGAFAGCTKLATVTFNAADAAQQIADGTFIGTAITNLDLTNTKVTRIERLFTDGTTTSNAKLAEVTFPAVMGTVVANAFNGCSALATVNFVAAAGAQTINAGAFVGTAIATLDLTNSKVGALNRLFTAGTGSNATLTSVKLAATTASIEDQAFDGCAKLSKIEWATNGTLATVGANAFNLTPTLTTIEFPASVQTFTDDFLAGSSIASMTINANTAVAQKPTIQKSGSTKLKTLTVKGAFKGIIGGGTTTYAFETLESVTFEGNLGDGTNAAITAKAFKGATLTTVTFKGTVAAAAIASGAFSECTKLATVTFEKNIDASGVGAGAFGTSGTAYAGSANYNATTNPLPLTVVYTPTAAAEAVKSFAANAFGTGTAPAYNYAKLSTSTTYATFIASASGYTHTNDDPADGIKNVFVDAAAPAKEYEVANNGTGDWYYAKFYETGAYKIAKNQESGAKVIVYTAYVDQSDGNVYMEQLHIQDGFYNIPTGKPVIIKSSTNDKVVATSTTIAAGKSSMLMDNTGAKATSEIGYLTASKVGQQLNEATADTDVEGRTYNNTIATGYDVYALAKISKYNITWKKFGDSTTLPAGTFYIHCKKGAAADRLNIVWLDGSEDSATAIKTVKKANAENGAIYNLAGQKVNASYKGVVIKDGKKYIQK